MGMVRRDLCRFTNFHIRFQIQSKPGDRITSLPKVSHKPENQPHRFDGVVIFGLSSFNSNFLFSSLSFFAERVHLAHIMCFVFIFD